MGPPIINEPVSNEPLTDNEADWVDVALEGQGAIFPQEYHAIWYKLNQLSPRCIRRMYLM